MIIWGSTGRESTCGSGDFFCPSCRRDSEYAHQRVQRYFTLYFIPLFPMNTVGEYVQCYTCGGQYNTEILDIPRERIRAMIEPWVCQRCGNNNAAEYGECLSCRSPRLAAPSQPMIAAQDDDIIEAESA